MRSYFYTLLIICLLSAAGCVNRQGAPAGGKVAAVKVDSVVFHGVPLFTNRERNTYITLYLSCHSGAKELRLQKAILRFAGDADVGSLKEVSLTCSAGHPEEVSNQSGVADDSGRLFGESPASRKVKISGDFLLKEGVNTVTLSLTASESARLTDRVQLKELRLFTSDRREIATAHRLSGDNVRELPSDHRQITTRYQQSAGRGQQPRVDVSSVPPMRFGTVVRAAGQDGSDTYRIPGLVTTNAGTLIAVYDMRHNSSKDLQQDIDVGMSRSTDGGESWEPVRVIMDMGEYGGLPQNLNGAGDPCVLYDHFTGTIWVAALWMSGSAADRMVWWDSGPGLTPQETGQFILIKSTDDGLTWSEPVNITRQVKEPAWQLLLQGPGRGITMSNGTLVFPAQFKADIGEKAIDGGGYTCHSTIVYSIDSGESWHIGTGARSNTTEAQVVELSDGSLMLNMRDDRNRTDKSSANGRAVAITRDMGETWTLHPSSNAALPEPNCMASLISADMALPVGKKSARQVTDEATACAPVGKMLVKPAPGTASAETVSGGKRRVLFFSNPNDKYDRIRMTIKMSPDEGMTWPEEAWQELYTPGGFGYSCLTMVDENYVGILYEGVRELYFQKVAVEDFFSDHLAVDGGHR